MNTSKMKIFLLGLVLIISASAVTAQNELPHLKDNQLIVDGQPFLMIAGELHNSSASSADYMEQIWPKLKSINLNTVLATVTWDQFEPEEGKYDYALIDYLIEKSAENNLKLVVIWFASWKNGQSSYIPMWVKEDTKRFPRAVTKDGKMMETLSVFSEDSRNADARAFTALMQRIKEKDLEDQITIELKDYRDLDGKFDKISSIGMYEAIGIKAVPEYLQKVRSLLKPDGIFLNHGITRKGKKKKTKFSSRPEQRALQKYIFPGGELDDLGNTIAKMEQTGFEVQDVEGWRMHYQLTTKLWAERLTANKEKAIEIVGEETYRIWVAYLAGCSLAFMRGSARLYQTVATHNAKAMPATPQTRADLYRT